MPTFECPTCHTRLEVPRPEDAPYRPFCSSRCKLIDLGRWLNEEYRVTEEVPEPAQTDDEDEDTSRDR